MKIQGWLVERFGALRNYEVRNLPGGLTIFYGPNGAGKSTLFTFLRQMLFGWGRPDAAGPDSALLHDGWAGRLSCAGPGGVYTIARTADRPSHVHITRPDGQEGGEADLECLLGGTDGRLVAPLLAFNVQDLRALPPLSTAGIRKRIFPDGVAGKRKSIHDALSTIQVRLSELAERAGGDPQRLLTTPVELQSHIDRSTRAALRYCQLLHAQAQARLEVDLRTRTISDFEADKARCDALIDLWPVWQELTQARHELSNIESFDGFPADPEERLERALAERQAAQRSVDQLVDREHSLRLEESVMVGAGIGKISDTGEAFLGTVARQSRPEHVDWADPRTETLMAWQRRLKDVEQAVSDRRCEIEATQRTMRDLELALNAIPTKVGRPEPPSTASLDEEARLLQHVRATLADLRSGEIATKRWQGVISEHSRTIRTLEAHMPRLPSAVLLHAAWVAAGLGITASVWRYAVGDTFGLSLLSVCSLASALGAAGQRSRRAQSLDENSSRLARLTALRGEVERACQSLLHDQERAARLRFDISVDSVRLGLPPMPSDRQLQEREAELDEQRRQRREADDAQTAFADTLAALDRSKGSERQQSEALLASQIQQQQTIQEWHQWKIHAGLTENVGALRGAGDATGTETKLLEDCRRLRTQIAEREREASEWNTRAQAALAGPVIATHPAYEHSPALQAARRRQSQCEEALAQFFSDAGASDEATFRTRLATYRRRLALEQTIRACEMRSSERLRQEPAPNAILLELPEGHVQEWRRRSARAAAELTDLKASCDQALEQLQQLNADACAASAESAHLPVLEGEQSGLATEAIEIVREWRALAIAASLLAETQRDVERESQPAVLRRASQVLSAVTSSRYDRLLQSEDQRELLVLDATSGRKSVEQLSRATVEQVYFSLRLGLAEEGAQCGALLPLVIDDVLDTFDPKRSRAMAHQLVELGRRHQILVFTCRPETCDLLRSLDPAANVITMQEL